MEKVIFHIDVNSAFLSWEATYRRKHLGSTKDLREMVSAVGGDMEMRRGIILAKSIPAKQYGIHTGESILEAKQKCPGLILVPPNYSLYEQCSQSFIDILRQYTPHVEQYSIDEAFIDMSGTEGLWGAPVIAANRIRIQISSELGFTVNIGISSNKILAKMASDFKKPDMIHTLFPEEIERKMWLLPVSELFFVGRATNITNEIHQAACKLFDELWNGEPIRHLGIHVSRIREGNTFRQIDFFDSTDYEKLERIDATADEIRERVGIDSVKRATFVTDKKERGIDHMSGGITREKRTVDYSKIKIE